MESVIQSNGKIAGTRISVYEVYYYLVNDWQPKDIAPVLQLSMEQIQSAMQYIGEHRAAVVAVHNEIEGRNARGNPPEVEAKLAKSREKMQAWLKERHQTKERKAWA
jgi:uncharacterized protein (DUF433 family)